MVFVSHNATHKAADSFDDLTRYLVFAYAYPEHAGSTRLVTKRGWLTDFKRALPGKNTKMQGIRSYGIHITLSKVDLLTDEAKLNLLT